MRIGLLLLLLEHPPGCLSDGSITLHHRAFTLPLRRSKMPKGRVRTVYLGGVGSALHTGSPALHRLLASTAV